MFAQPGPEEQKPQPQGRPPHRPTGHTGLLTQDFREDEAGRPRPSGGRERRSRDRSPASRTRAGGAQVNEQSASGDADREASAQTQQEVEEKEDNVKASLLSRSFYRLHASRQVESKGTLVTRPHGGQTGSVL